MAPSRRPRPDAPALEAWEAWLRAHRVLLATLDRELRDGARLSVDDYDVLVQLARAPEQRRKMSQLADALLLARSSCTRIVGRLEDRGWVERRTDADDGRIVWATLTTAGRRVQRRAAVVHLAGVQQHFGRHLTERDAASITGLARRIEADR
jgi:DNA-binding MarR family transcriptional regulator